MKKSLKRFWRWFTLADLGQVQIAGEGSTQVQVGRSYEVVNGRRVVEPVTRNVSQVQIRGDHVEVTVSGSRAYVIRLLEAEAASLKEKQ